MNNLIDGRAIAADIHQETLVRVSTLKHRGIQPGLAFIRVGEDPASQVYVGMKEKKARELGIQSHTTVLPEKTTQAELLAERNVTGELSYYGNSQSELEAMARHCDVRTDYPTRLGQQEVEDLGLDDAELTRKMSEAAADRERAGAGKKRGFMCPLDAEDLRERRAHGGEHFEELGFAVADVRLDERPTDTVAYVDRTGIQQDPLASR